MKALFFLSLLVITSAAATAADWNRFRGPEGSGVVTGTPIPLEWSSESNLRWKSSLPGKGSSSPIVSHGKIFVTCYTGYGIDIAEPGDPSQLVRHLIAFDLATGQELWRKSVASQGKQDPYQGFITQHGYASSTPVSDGERVFVVFGKSGLFAFDHDGNELWNVDLGQKSDPAKWGDGSSPILVGDTLVIDAGILGHKFVGINKLTGDELWSLEDPGYTNSWSTPTPIRIGEQDQVLVHVPKRVLALNPTDGAMIWSADSPLPDATCASIVSSEGKAYLMGSRAGNAMAVTCDGSGDVSDTHTLWQKPLRSGICTPLLLGSHLYWLSGGIFYAADVTSGEYAYKERLPRKGSATRFPNVDYSSAIAVDDKIIQFTRNGESYVIQAGGEFELVAHNPAFGDDESAFSATPAITDGALIVRSESSLYCISED